MMAKKIFLGFLGTVLLIAFLVSCGCTSTQNAQPAVRSTIPAATTPVQTTIQPTSQATTVTTTVPATVAATTAAANTDVLTVTVNSAVLKTVLGDSTPKAGNIFLVLDVTIQNNDKNNDFEYTDSSFGFFDKNHNNYRTAVTSRLVRTGLNNPLSSGSIPLKSTIKGQVVCGVMANSNSYKFTISDSKGNVIATVDNITVS